MLGSVFFIVSSVSGKLKCARGLFIVIATASQLSSRVDSVLSIITFIIIRSSRCKTHLLKGFLFYFWGSSFGLLLCVALFFVFFFFFCWMTKPEKEQHCNQQILLFSIFCGRRDSGDGAWLWTIRYFKFRRGGCFIFSPFIWVGRETLVSFLNVSMFSIVPQVVYWIHAGHYLYIFIVEEAQKKEDDNKFEKMEGKSQKMLGKYKNQNFYQKRKSLMDWSVMERRLHKLTSAVIRGFL